MIATAASNRFKPLPLMVVPILAVLAGAGYWIAFSLPAAAAAILAALPCLCLLGRLRTARLAFYGGMATGLLMYVPHLAFFWSIFGPVAMLLWLVAAFPMGLFLLLLNGAHRRLGGTWACWLTPVLWTGVEYFRSELYYFRFAWLLPGQAAAFLPGVRWAWIGVYGLGFLYVASAALIVAERRRVRSIGLAAAIGFAALMYMPGPPPPPPDGSLHVAGVQLELPEASQAVAALERLAAAHPEAQILVLSEYTFRGPVPQAVRDVVRRHQRYLIVGGMKVLEDGRFYDTAFVLGPDGKDVFEQAKSVPVQCMDDGLAAPQRRVWASPWGKIGIAVCYDLGYARMMDDFVRQGAAGLIVPTMDAAHWGEHERRMLHGRVAPIRSAEYAIPTFGVWSSGVSQLTDRFGRVVATAGYPGQGEMIAGPFDLRNAGRLPLDRLLAAAAVVGTGLFVMFLAVGRIKQQLPCTALTSRRRRSPPIDGTVA